MYYRLMAFEVTMTAHGADGETQVSAMSEAEPSGDLLAALRAKASAAYRVEHGAWPEGHRSEIAGG